MIDSELLNLAANAAGYKVHSSGKLFWIWKDSNVEWVDWNPLTDDGDALRLAIDLELDVSLGKNSAVVEFGQLQIEELGASDPYAAGRRAIVRAAAEIGRKMK